jgi:hypothetical protein
MFHMDLKELQRRRPNAHTHVLGKLLDDIVATDLKSRCRRLKRFDKEPKHARRGGISRIACL